MEANRLKTPHIAVDTTPQKHFTGSLKVSWNSLHLSILKGLKENLVFDSLRRAHRYTTQRIKAGQCHSVKKAIKPAHN